MFGIIIITTPVSINEIKKMAESQFGELVKAVVDIETGAMALGGELHSDEEKQMIENGSEQKNLWGINIYPEAEGDNKIEFDSMINIRPYAGNRTRSVDNPEIQKRIIEIV